MLGRHEGIAWIPAFFFKCILRIFHLANSLQSAQECKYRRPHDRVAEEEDISFSFRLFAFPSMCFCCDGLLFVSPRWANSFSQSSVLFPKPQSIFGEGLTVKYAVSFFFCMCVICHFLHKLLLALFHDRCNHRNTLKYKNGLHMLIMGQIMSAFSLYWTVFINTFQY